MVTVCFGGPCSIMTFSYYNILRVVKKSRQQVHGAKVTEITIQSNRQQRRRQEDLKLASTFLVVIFIFIICWLPYCITMFWSVFGETKVPKTADMTTILLGCANSACNPIIYGVMNKKFRNGYRKLFCCFQFRRSSTSMDGNTITMR